VANRGIKENRNLSGKLFFFGLQADKNNETSLSV
jgi:hypothetical protein